MNDIVARLYNLLRDNACVYTDSVHGRMPFIALPEAGPDGFISQIDVATADWLIEEDGWVHIKYVNDIDRWVRQ